MDTPNCEVATKTRNLLSSWRFKIVPQYIKVKYNILSFEQVKRKLMNSTIIIENILRIPYNVFLTT